MEIDSKIVNTNNNKTKKAYNSNTINNTKSSNPKKVNKFKFESFAEKLSKINVRFTSDMDNNISFLEVGNQKELKLDDSQSNLISIIEKEKELNQTEEFNETLYKIMPLCDTYISIVSYAKTIYEILKNDLFEVYNIYIEDLVKTTKLNENIIKELGIIDINNKTLFENVVNISTNNIQNDINVDIDIDIDNNLLVKTHNNSIEDDFKQNDNIKKSLKTIFRGEAYKSTFFRMSSILDLIVSLVKDIRTSNNYINDEILNKILPLTINLILISDVPNDIDKSFMIIANLIKLMNSFFSNKENIKILFKYYSPLIFNKTSYIKRFAAESLVYIFKNCKVNEGSFNFVLEYLYLEYSDFNNNAIKKSNSNNSNNNNNLILTCLDMNKDLFKDKKMLFSFDRCSHISNLFVEYFINSTKEKLSPIADKLIDNLLSLFNFDLVCINNTTTTTNAVDRYNNIFNSFIILFTKIFISLFNICYGNPNEKTKLNALDLFILYNIKLINILVDNINCIINEFTKLDNNNFLNYYVTVFNIYDISLNTINSLNIKEKLDILQQIVFLYNDKLINYNNSILKEFFNKNNLNNYFTWINIGINLFFKELIIDNNLNLNSIVVFYYFDIMNKQILYYNINYQNVINKLSLNEVNKNLILDIIILSCIMFPQNLYKSLDNILNNNSNNTYIISKFLSSIYINSKSEESTSNFVFFLTNILIYQKDITYDNLQYLSTYKSIDYNKLKSFKDINKKNRKPYEEEDISNYNKERKNLNLDINIMYILIKDIFEYTVNVLVKDNIENHNNSCFVVLLNSILNYVINLNNLNNFTIDKNRYSLSLDNKTLSLLSNNNINLPFYCNNYTSSNILTILYNLELINLNINFNKDKKELKIESYKIVLINLLNNANNIIEKEIDFSNILFTEEYNKIGISEKSLCNYSFFLNLFYYKIQLNKKVYFLNSDVILRSVYYILNSISDIEVFEYIKAILLENSNFIAYLKYSLNKPFSIDIINILFFNNNLKNINKNFNTCEFQQFIEKKLDVTIQYYIEYYLINLILSPNQTCKEKILNLTELLIEYYIDCNLIDFNNLFRIFYNILKSKKDLINSKECVVLLDELTFYLENNLNVKTYLMKLNSNNITNENQSLNINLTCKKLKNLLKVFKLIFNYLLSCYWINLTKDVWPSINKSLQMLFNNIKDVFVNLINNQSNNTSNNDNISVEYIYYIDTYNKLIRLIKRIGSSDELYKKHSHLAKHIYSKFNDLEKDTLNEDFKSNNIDLNNNDNKFDTLNYNLISNYETYNIKEFVNNINKELVGSNYLSNLDIIGNNNCNNIRINISNRLSIFILGFIQNIPNINNLLNLSKSIKKENYISCSLYNSIMQEAHNFLNYHINTITFNTFFNYFKTDINYNNNINIKCNDNNNNYIYELNLLYNYTLEKSNNVIPSRSINHIRLTENILLIYNSIDPVLFNNENSLYLSDLTTTINNLIMNSRNLNTQKLCIQILSNINPYINLNKSLLIKAAENYNVIEELYNIENIKNYNNKFIKDDLIERKIVIEMLIRIYYSKYFGLINNERKKMKVKNKSSLVIFFSQLNKEDISFYYNLMCNDCCEGYTNYESSNFTYMYLFKIKKFLNILNTNFKQLRYKFEQFSCDLINLLTNILVFNKNSSIYFSKLDKLNKHDTSNIGNSINVVLSNMLSLNKNSNIIKSLYNNTLIEDYKKHYNNISKDIRKEILSVLIVIYNAFSDNNKDNYNNLQAITNSVESIVIAYKEFFEYKMDNVTNTSLSTNIVFDFFFSLTRNINLHYLFNNCIIKSSVVYYFKSISSIKKEINIDNVFLIKIITLIDNLITSKYKYLQYLEHLYNLKIDNIDINSQYVDWIELNENNDFNTYNNKNAIDKYKDINNIKVTNNLMRIKCKTLNDYYNTSVFSNNIIFSYFKYFINLMTTLIEKERVFNNINYKLNEQYIETIVKLYSLIQPSSLELMKISKSTDNNDCQKNINNSFYESEYFSNCNFSEELLVDNNNSHNVDNYYNIYNNLLLSLEINDIKLINNYVCSILTFNKSIIHGDNDVILYNLLKILLVNFNNAKFRINVNIDNNNNNNNKSSNLYNNNEIIFQDIILPHYNILVHLIYQIEEINCRILLVQILNYYSFISSETKSVLLKLNKKTKQNTLDKDYINNASSDTNNENILNILSNDTFELIKNDINSYSTEPIIYQLLYFLKEDGFFYLQGLSLKKLKDIFSILIDIIYKRSSNENFEFVDNKGLTTIKVCIDVIYSMIKYSKSSTLINYLLSLISYIIKYNNKFENNEIVGKYICEDLHKPIIGCYTSNNNENNNNNKDLNLNLNDNELEKNTLSKNIDYINNLKDESITILEGLMHIKLSIRLETFNTILNLLKEENAFKISSSSIVNIVLPIIKFILSPNAYSNSNITDNVKKIIRKGDFNVFTESKDVNMLNKISYDILKLCPSFISINDTKELLYYFYNKSKTNKNNDYTKMYYTAISFILEGSPIELNYNFNQCYENTIIELISLNYSKYNLLDSNNKSNILNTKQVHRDLENIRNEDNKLLFKSIKKLNENYYSHYIKNQIDINQQQYEFNTFVKFTLFNYVKLNTINIAKKNKKNIYYIDNLCLKSMLIICKKLDPFKFQQEILKLFYEIISNLKNKEYAIREKAREALLICINIIGISIIPILLNELKYQLNSGYQTFVLSHIVSYFINYLHKNFSIDTNNYISNNNNNNCSTIIFDSILISCSNILLNDIFKNNNIDDESSFDVIKNKYPEAKLKNKSIDAFNKLSERITINNNLCLMIFSIWFYIGKLDFNSEITSNINMLFNNIAIGIKNNVSLNYKTFYFFAYGLISLNSNSNEKSNKFNKFKSDIIIKGDSYLDIDNYAPPSLINQQDAKFVLQKGITNYNRLTEKDKQQYNRVRNDEYIKSYISYIGIEIIVKIINSYINDLNSNNNSLLSINEVQEFKDKILEVLNLIMSIIKDCKFNKLLNKSLGVIVYMLRLNFNNKNTFSENKTLDSNYNANNYNNNNNAIIESIDDNIKLDDINLDISYNEEGSYNNNNIKSAIFNEYKEIAEHTKNKSLFNLDNEFIIDAIVPYSKILIAVLLKNLNISQDIELSQTILKCIGEILLKFQDKIKISDEKIENLLTYTKLNIHNNNLRVHIYSCLLKLLKIKIFHPHVFDTIKLVIENYIEASQNSIRNICSNIIIEFITEYISSIAEYISSEHNNNKYNSKNNNKNNTSINIVNSWREKVISTLIVNIEGESVIYCKNSIALLNLILQSSKINTISSSLCEIIFLKLMSMYVSEHLNEEIKNQLDLLYINILDSKLNETRVVIIIKRLKSQLKEKIALFCNNEEECLLVDKLNLKIYLEVLLAISKGLCAYKSNSSISINNKNTYNYISNSIIREAIIKSLKDNHDLVAKNNTININNNNNNNLENYNIFSILSDLLNGENYKTVKFIENYIEESKHVANSSQLIKISIPNYEILYTCLLIIENFISSDKELIPIPINDNIFIYQILKTLEHPNFNIKYISSNIINVLLNKIAYIYYKKLNNNNKETIDYKLVDTAVKKTTNSCIANIRNNNIDADFINKDKCYDSIVKGLSLFFTNFVSDKNKVITFRDNHIINYLFMNITLILMQTDLSQKTEESCLLISEYLCKSCLFIIIDNNNNNNNNNNNLEYIVNYNKETAIYSLKEYFEELFNESKSYLNSNNEYANLIAKRVITIYNNTINYIVDCICTKTSKEAQDLTIYEEIKSIKILILKYIIELNLNVNLDSDNKLKTNVIIEKMQDILDKNKYNQIFADIRKKKLLNKKRKKIN